MPSLDRSALKQLLVRTPRLYGAVARAHRVIRYLRRIPHEPEFAYFATLPDRDGLFLDIGANTGTSAMSFRLFNKRSRILSIEPNPVHRRDLELVKRLVPRFEYMLCGAGEHNERVTLHVPVYRGIPVTGEASLTADELVIENSWFLRDVPRASPAHFSIMEVPVEVRRLDELELTPQYVKIDVEGAELSVLRGLDETIRRCRPIMLIEEVAAPDVEEHLHELDYEMFGLAASADRLVPYQAGVFANVFCVPREQVDAVAAGERSQRPASASTRRSA
jgi:FkbM family methyltransferase